MWSGNGRKFNGCLFENARLMTMSVWVGYVKESGKVVPGFNKAIGSRTVLACFVPALFALPVAATEHEVSEFGSILDTCYAAAETVEDRKACLGQMSQTCMDSQEGGHSTLGMTSCLNAEANVWDKHLNVEYKATMAAFRAMDTDEAEYFPQFANRADTLRDAQRAWIAFRDGECALAYAMWGSGSMRNIAHADCRLQMTADRVIELQNLGAEMR